MRFYVVGSTLTRADPRDFDLLGVMEDDHFQAVYGLTAEQFLEEGRTGEWSPGRVKWKDECIGATRILQELLPDRVSIDFKIIPESLLREPYKPISLRQLLVYESTKNTIQNSIEIKISSNHSSPAPSDRTPRWFRKPQPSSIS